jgi:hypothetical protein
MTNKTKPQTHTPAPWMVGTGWIYGGSNQGDPIGAYAVCRIGVNPADDANARLIAAAPDLLEAAKLMIAQFEDGSPYVAKATNALRAAIAKARGVKS